MVVRGQVTRVTDRETKFGKFYSFQVNGEYYGVGKSTGGVSAGDHVEFEADKNERGYWDVKKGTIKPVEVPAETKPATKSMAKEAAPYVDTRQDSIVYQSSRKDALHFVEIAQVAGLIDYGKVKGADKLAILEAHVDRMTEHFIDEVKQNKAQPSQPLDSPKATRGATKAEPSETDFDDELPFN